MTDFTLRDFFHAHQHSVLTPRNNFIPSGTIAASPVNTPIMARGSRARSSGRSTFHAYDNGTTANTFIFPVQPPNATLELPTGIVTRHPIANNFNQVNNSVANTSQAEENQPDDHEGWCCETSRLIVENAGGTTNQQKKFCCHFTEGLRLHQMWMRRKLDDNIAAELEAKLNDMSPSERVIYEETKEIILIWHRNFRDAIFDEILVGDKPEPPRISSNEGAATTNPQTEASSPAMESSDEDDTDGMPSTPFEPMQLYGHTTSLESFLSDTSNGLFDSIDEDLFGGNFLQTEAESVPAPPPYDDFVANMGLNLTDEAAFAAPFEDLFPVSEDGLQQNIPANDFAAPMADGDLGINPMTFLFPTNHHAGFVM